MSDAGARRRGAPCEPDRILLPPPEALHGLFDGVPLHALLGLRLTKVSADLLVARLPFRRELGDGIRGGGAPAAVLLAALEALATFHAGLEIAGDSGPEQPTARFAILRGLAPKTLRLEILSGAPRRDIVVQTTVSRRSAARLRLDAVVRAAVGAPLATGELTYLRPRAGARTDATSELG